MIREEFWDGFMQKEALYNQYVKYVKPFIARHGVESLGKETAENLVKSVGNRGPADSLFMWPIKSISKLLIGKKRHERIGNVINKAILNTDMILGKPFDVAASKMKFTSGMFKQKELVPLGNGLHKEVHRSSLTAPLGTVSAIAVPMIASDVLYRKLKKEQGETPGGTI